MGCDGSYSLRQYKPISHAANSFQLDQQILQEDRRKDYRCRQRLRAS